MEEFNRWDAVADEIDQKVNKLVRTTAFKIERRAKQNATPMVKTGFHRGSIYVRTEDESDFGSSSKGQLAFPEISMPAHNEAYIAVGAIYGMRLEYGFMQADSKGRVYNQPAHPYLTPACEAERQPFLAALEKLANGEGIKG